jgi:T4 RnlA family RNA ligase
MQMYEDHCKLINDPDNTFYVTKQVVDGRKLEIFNYRLASWTQFLLPNAMEARGITYDVTDMPVIVSRPMPKFFNFSEGTEKHVGHIRTRMDKLDGSLGSSSIINNKLRMKSKGSYYSDQASKMQSIADDDEYLHNSIMFAENNGYTVNVEFTSPDNRIVVFYHDTKVRILNVRHRDTGVMKYGDSLKEFFSDYRPEYFVDYVNENNHDLYTRMTEFKNETVGEGYVCEIVRPDGSTYLVKQKNDAYAAMHKIKDNITSADNLIDCILNGSSDDLKAMFHDDLDIIQRITDFEKIVIPVFNKFVNDMNKFVDDNKHMVAKEFAGLAKSKVGDYFGVAMNSYRGKEVNYVEVAQKYKKTMFALP